MPSPAVYFTPRLTSLIPPSSRSSPPSLVRRNDSTSLRHFPTDNYRCKKKRIRFWNIARGKSIIVAPLKVVSYLPNSDSSPRKKVVSSTSPSSEVKSAESIEEYTVIRKLETSGRITLDPFRGKSGCVSFCGLSHQFVEARNLVSSPFEDGKGSVIWIAAPIALISSLLLPQFFINNAIELFVKNEVFKDSLPRKKVVSSTSPSTEVKSAESIEEYTVLRKLETSGRITLDPFRGKSGCVSFCGLSHQLVEARYLVSSPFEDGKGSVIWIAASIALISSLLLPQFFINNAIELFVKNEVFKDIVTFFSAEIIFYIGLGIFLSITDRVQRPYIDFSPKQWSLITGLKGYLSSAFFSMGVKVVAPIAGVYVVWPVIPLPAIVAVAPFLLGCAVQFAFELHLDKRQSSCWPVLPIIFEVYRLYQLSRASHFLEKLMFSMKGAQMTPKVIERGNALVSLVVLFQILAVVCLWSLTTFLLRLFPSRPVAENY